MRFTAARCYAAVRRISTGTRPRRGRRPAPAGCRAAASPCPAATGRRCCAVPGDRSRGRSTPGCRRRVRVGPVEVGTVVLDQRDGAPRRRGAGQRRQGAFAVHLCGLETPASASKVGRRSTDCTACARLRKFSLSINGVRDASHGGAAEGRVSKAGPRGANGVRRRRCRRRPTRSSPGNRVGLGVVAVEVLAQHPGAVPGLPHGRRVSRLVVAAAVEHRATGSTASR